MGRLPRPLQRRPGSCRDRALAGGGDADRPAAPAGRPRPGGSQRPRVGDHPRRKRHGPDRQGRGRELREHPGLQVLAPRSAVSWPTRRSTPNRPRTASSAEPGQGVSVLLPGRRSRFGRDAGPLREPGVARRVASRLSTRTSPRPELAAGLGSESAGSSRRVNSLGRQSRTSTRGNAGTAKGASWLQVSAPVNPGDTRAIVSQTLGPTWGLHLVDVNIALGNLVTPVADEATAYDVHSGTPASPEPTTGPRRSGALLVSSFSYRSRLSSGRLMTPTISRRSVGVVRPCTGGGGDR